ncbi:MAG: hypothetical protein WD875_10940 [Pirellulales bacterium]
MSEVLVQDVASHLAALDAIDRRQDEILVQLDELNEHILQVLTANGVAVPQLPPVFRRDKKAA